MNESELVMVVTTINSAETARQLAIQLVELSLAACVQVDGPIESHYRWRGKTECATEYRLTIKTLLTAWPKLQEKLASLHPYEEPEIIMQKITDASDGYRKWVTDQST